MASELAADGYPVDALRENWHSANELSFELAQKIEDHCIRTGERFDKMILIPRGSYPVGNIVSRRLGFSADHILHMCMTTYRDGETESSGQFRYGQMPTPEDVKGLDLVIIEEVCDTGETLSHAEDLLRLAGAGLVRSGVLHFKPGKTTTGYTPDWFANTTDSWIVYPWEKDERIGQGSIVRRPTMDEVVEANGYALS